MEKKSTRIVRRSASVPGLPLSPSIAHHHRHVIVTPSPQISENSSRSLPETSQPFPSPGARSTFCFVPFRHARPGPPFRTEYTTTTRWDYVVQYPAAHSCPEACMPSCLRRCYRARHLLRVRSSVVIRVIIVIRTAVVVLMVVQ